ncbi:MAG TPA: ATP-binding protein [Hymenobacter sp.]|jgi:signal transduction histidine kinase|uniref:ATP-binding protein n=1 Tax=Hymenobacter sp. TaxID=1898978 RepID=UPI002EDA8140
MKRVLVVWLFGWLASANSLAQTPAADRLRAAVLAHPTADTVRANRLNRLAFELRNNAPAESAGWFRQALDLSQQLRYTAGAAEAQLGLGFYHRHRGEYDQAKRYTEFAQQTFRQQGDALGQTRSLYNLSCVYSEQGMYAKSLTANIQGLALAEAAKNGKWQSFLNTRLGITSMFLGEYGHAHDYLTQGLYWAKQAHDTISIGHAYAGLGDMYRTQGQWADAQRNYEQDAAIFRRLKDESGLLFEDINLGDVHERQGHYQQAFAFGFSGLGRARRLQALTEMPRAQLLLARAFLHTGQPDSALAYGRQSLRASQRNGTKDISRDASEVLAQASFQRERFADAYLYEHLFGTYKDSLNSADLQRRAAVLEYRSQLDRKQAQISLLTETGHLIRKQNRQQQWYLLGALVGLGAVGGLSMVLWRNNREKQRAYALLKQQQDELRAAQTQLVQAEKWALVGELSAGIAHELQNPLNFMKNFAEVSVAMLNQDKAPASAGAAASADLEQKIMAGLRQNLQQISQHGQRASSIINGMLEHARSGTGQPAPCDLNALAEESLRLAYQGLRAKDASFSAVLRQELDSQLGLVHVVPQDMGRVLLNLCTNALHAVRQRQQQFVALSESASYQPTVVIETRRLANNAVEIRVRDNGVGMSEAVQKKVFEPFFTTKPAGEGTGLGLSLSHDTVTKGHGGTLTVFSHEDRGTEFTITLPA